MLDSMAELASCFESSNCSMPHNNSYFAVFLTGLLLLGFHADGALAGEEVIAYESNKFTLGVGVGILKFRCRISLCA